MENDNGFVKIPNKNTLQRKKHIHLDENETNEQRCKNGNTTKLVAVSLFLVPEIISLNYCKTDLYLEGHFDNLYHTSATDTVWMAFIGL